MAQDINFLPEDYLERRLARRTNIICLTLFGVVMVGLVAAFFVSGRQEAEVRALHAEVSASYEEAARRLEQLEQLQDQKEQMLHKAQVTSVLVERVPRSLVLAELTNHMPMALSLTAFDLETRVLRTPPGIRTSLQAARDEQQAEASTRVEVPETEVTLVLEGVAPTDSEVSAFLAALVEHAMFEEVELQYSEPRDVGEQRVRTFEMEAKLAQGLDMRRHEPTRVKRELEQDPMGDWIEVGDAW